jgi:SnoaL-like domain
MRIEAPSTYQALRFVAARYAAGVDQRDTTLFLSAFAPDAALVLPQSVSSSEPGRELNGHNEIATIIDLIARYPRTYHFIGQARYQFDTAACAGEVYCVAHHMTPEEDRDLVMYVRYLDTYRYYESSDSWLLGKRVVNVDWTQNLAGATGREAHP